MLELRVYTGHSGRYKNSLGELIDSGDHPEWGHLKDEWNDEKNSPLTIYDVTPGSNKKRWWKCKNGHEWDSVVGSRTSCQKQGCPYCPKPAGGRRRASPEYNFSVKSPEVAKDWHPTKNGDLTPEDVTPGSNKKRWWICEKGHEWDASPSKRGRMKRGCPYCANQKIWNTGDERDNHLAATHPDVAAQWHPTKNGDLTPEGVVSGSGRKVWWICEKGHEWEKRVNKKTRAKSGTRCKECILHKTRRIE